MHKGISNDQHDYFRGITGDPVVNLKVTGLPKHVMCFLEENKGKQTPISFRRLEDVPKYLQKKDIERWMLSHWGCAEDIDDIRCWPNSTDGGSYSLALNYDGISLKTDLHFECKTRPCDIWLFKISLIYRNLTFTLNCGNEFVTIQGGIVIESSGDFNTQRLFEDKLHNVIDAECHDVTKEFDVSVTDDNAF